MLSPRVRNSFAMLALVFVILACGAPSIPVTGPTEAAPVDVPAVGAGDAAPTEAPSSNTASGDAPVAGPSIQHTDIPVGLPEKTSGQAGDFDSSKVLSSGSLIGGDRFTFGRFERPFNANAMDVYFSQIDIVNTEVFQDDMFIYARITLKDLGASSSQTAQYAVELDTTRNGKANWLVIVGKPESTEWTVNGVQVYQDTNGSVGGEMPYLTDTNPVSGDGFDQLFFDQGQGEDPDTAWVRISPNDANIVEVAIKIAAIGSPKQYLINMWAGHNLDPAKFDLNDAYTHEQAGAADAGLQIFYPIKEVAEVDNSCRMAVGFQPTGNEPGLCDTYKPEQVGDPANPATCNATPIVIFFCNQQVAMTWDPGSCSCVSDPPR